MAGDWDGFDDLIRNADQIEKTIKKQNPNSPYSGGGGSGRQRSYKSGSKRRPSPSELKARRRGY